MRVLRSFVVLVLLVSLVAAPAGGQPDEGPFGDDVAFVGTADTQFSSTEVSLALSAATFEDGSVETVLIGRNDLFADSLASGVAQSGSPLLLVAPTGAINVIITDEIERLGASRAVILGGVDAIAEDVADQLTELGLTVSRLEGASRIETAIAVAQETSPDATTALLARSTAAEGNPTSGFADTLAAGGWSAASGWPTLLTQTEVLTGSTRDYLASSSVTTVIVLGWTAAVSDDVVTQLETLNITVQRVAGPDRAATAVAIAAERGAESSADLDEVIVVEGFGEFAWAAGFAAAARSAILDSPIVLGNVDSVPPATSEWLEEGPEAFTCGVSLEVCEAARLRVGLPPSIAVPVPVGALAYTVADDENSAIYAAAFDGEVLGLAWDCESPNCDQIDFGDDGEYLAVREPGDGTYALWQETLELRQYVLPWREDTLGNVVSLDAGTNRDAETNVATLSANGERYTQRVSQFGQFSSGGYNAERFASFQAVRLHPDATLEGSPTELAISGGQLITSDINVVPQLQARAGAAITGAAWASDYSGDLAIVDEIGGEGLLRTAAHPDGPTVEAADLDVNSAPVWLADNTVAVLVDTADGVAVAIVDPSDGSSEIVVEDAGNASGGRISGDASGTFIAWRTTGDIRILDTRDGSVAIVEPPAGMTIAGGPTFRN